jgi:hypothetical protein
MNVNLNDVLVSVQYPIRGGLTAYAIQYELYMETSERHATWRLVSHSRVMRWSDLAHIVIMPESHRSEYLTDHTRIPR